MQNLAIHPEDEAAWAEATNLHSHEVRATLGRRIAVAESLTIGRVQTELGRWSGASKYFAGGLTAYNLRTKIQLLGVDAAHGHEVNAVSARVAEEMASGVARLFDTQIGVSTTGYADPDFARSIPQPYAWVAISDGGRVRAQRVKGDGLSRGQMQTRAALAALQLLLHTD